MTARKIMVIRHAEKPDDAGTIFGVDVQGNQKREEQVPQLLLSGDLAEAIV